MTNNFVELNTNGARQQAYQDVIGVLIRHCEEYPDSTTSDILAILGKAAGFCVGLHRPENREKARAVVTVNLDMATKEIVGEQ